MNNILCVSIFVCNNSNKYFFSPIIFAAPIRSGDPFVSLNFRMYRGDVELSLSQFFDVITYRGDVEQVEESLISADIHHFFFNIAHFNANFRWMNCCLSQLRCARY